MQEVTEQKEGRSSDKVSVPVCKESTREQKIFALRYIGQTGAGIHVFRHPATPLQLVTMDGAEYREWQAIQRRYGLAPIIDAEAQQARNKAEMTDSVIRYIQMAHGLVGRSV